MVKKNEIRKSHSDFKTRYFSAVARRTRSKEEQFIARKAADLNIGNKRDFRRHISDDDDVVEIGVEEMRVKLNEKRKGKAKIYDTDISDDDDRNWLKRRRYDRSRFDEAEKEKEKIFVDFDDDDDDDDDGEWMKRKPDDQSRFGRSGEEPAMGFSDDDDDELLKRKPADQSRFGRSEEKEPMGNFDGEDEDPGFFEISKHEMFFGVAEKKTAKSGSSCSVMKTHNVKNNNRGSLYEEEDEVVEIDRIDLGFDHVNNRTSKSVQESTAADAGFDTPSTSKKWVIYSSSSSSSTSSSDDDIEDEDYQVDMPLTELESDDSSSFTDDESDHVELIEKERPKQRRRRFRALRNVIPSEDEVTPEPTTSEDDAFIDEISTVKEVERDESCSNNNNNNNEIPSDGEATPEPMTSEGDCIVVVEDETNEVAVEAERDEPCSNNNKDEIGVLGDLDRTEVRAEVESDDSVLQTIIQLDSPVEIIGQTFRDDIGAEANNVGAENTIRDAEIMGAENRILDAEMKDGDAAEKTESEKIDETVGSCNNNNQGADDEGGLNVEICAAGIEQVEAEMRKAVVGNKIGSEKLFETVGSCNNNTGADMGASGSDEKTEVPSVESVIENTPVDVIKGKEPAELNQNADPNDETVEVCLRKLNLGKNSEPRKTQEPRSYRKPVKCDHQNMEEAPKTKIPSVESVTEKTPPVDVNIGKEPIGNTVLNENADLHEENAEFSPRKTHLRGNNETRKTQEPRPYRVTKMKLVERNPVRCAQKVEGTPKTSADVAMKKRPASARVVVSAPRKKVAKLSQTKGSSGAKESAEKSTVVNSGEPENHARSAEILIDSRPARTPAPKTSVEYDCRPEREATVEDEKSSEDIYWGRPNARRGSRPSDDPCDVLLNAILMTEQNEAEKKIFNSEYDPVNVAKRNNVITHDQLKFFYGAPEQTPIIQKTPDELELESMWAELDFALMGEEIDFDSPHEGGTKRGDEGVSEHRCINGDHVFRLDEEIGLICTRCSFISIEIRHYLPPEAMQPQKLSRLLKKGFELDGEEVQDGLEELQFQTPGAEGRSSGNPREGGTVWDIIPGVKDTMYQHQQEGFEFMWRNLEGTLSLNELKQSESRAGGCIISHAPGTGKTRLTITFLQTYLELFPNSRPLIIAPASMLLTWEEEFKKWGVTVPFHNLNNLDQSSGKDNLAQIDIVNVSQKGWTNKDTLRLGKLFLWCKQKSILGISYTLYETLVGDDKAKHKMFRRILLDYPGLLVLDEGHRPRNEHSGIWKALKQVETQRRIILSGTPFQNNFVELSNILCLVRPDFVDQIPRSLKNFCQKRSLVPKRKVAGIESCVPTEKLEDHAIEELKVIIAPFVHVHKGSILKESLPGLKDCVIVLNPANEIQRNLIDTIDGSRGNFEYDHILALATTHPSLVLEVSHSINKGSSADKTLLQDIRLNPNEGSKTSFLTKLIRFSVAMNEKVLVFSQYKLPFELITEQLSSLMNWTEGRELLVMQGKVDQERRQYMINVFNDPDSAAKVLLASTKSCSEGINLVGASRVVLLDVVWNPSVERQAISRAYRIGQKKVVHTYHLIMLDTPEWDKFCTQSEKDRLSEMVFCSSEPATEKQKICLGSEDRILEKMLSHEHLNGLIAKVIYQPKETKLLETFW